MNLTIELQVELINHWLAYQPETIKEAYEKIEDSLLKAKTILAERQESEKSSLSLLTRIKQLLFKLVNVFKDKKCMQKRPVQPLPQLVYLQPLEEMANSVNKHRESYMLK